MLSYRHAFHAGNHADVLKHMVLLATLRHMTQKETAFTVFDTHAGAGLYRLDSEYADTSGEAVDGFLRLVAPNTAKQQAPLAAVVQDYIDLVASFNSKGSHKVYPGSPFIIQRFLRERDKLKLFEIHPTDAKTLAANIAQLEAGRQVALLREDGFTGIRKFLPPPTRRALLLCDPSYEIKHDYQQVPEMMADALQRFATGTYVVWYPIIPRPQAHDLPRKLKTLSNKSGRTWLNVSLTVKSSKITVAPDGQSQRPGLPASGVFVINPPHTLKSQLQAAMPQLVARLSQDRNASFALESGS